MGNLKENFWGRKIYIVLSWNLSFLVADNTTFNYFTEH